MRTTLAVLAVLLQGACATERPAPSPDPQLARLLALPDGGQLTWRSGEDCGAPCGNFTRPRVDLKILTEGLMPKGHAGGSVIVRCAVTAEGQIHDCASLRDEAGLASAVIERLESMRATPATFNGKPWPIDYVFNFLFKP